MKKIYINETSLGNIKEYGLLPNFLFKMVKGHKTSLGDSEAFPKVGEYPFDYSIIKKRFEDVSFHIKSTLNKFDEDSLMSELSSLVSECKGLEEPIKDSLERLAENSINRLFAIPEGTINFTFKLVGTVSFKNSPRITPESDENIKFSFKDIADINHSNKAVEKRRFINALIQGGARRMLETALSSDEVAYADLGKLNPHLITLYKKILYINDYLLFTKPEKLDDKKPMQGSYVEAHLGSDGNRSTIDAQGIIFPLLLQEAIKGIFELFSSHGLPSDRNKAMYVIKKADYILAEPWDMRFGPTLWDMIFGGIEDSNLVPYAFTNLIKLPTDEFNSSVREILADTETGKEIIGDIVNSAKNDSDYQEFTNRIKARNMEKSVIADSYFTAAELDGLDMDSEESDVIEESENGDVDYMGLIENATVNDIDFEEGRTVAGNGEELILTIKGVKIPPLIVSLVVYLVGIEVEGKPARVLNLHIILDKAIQGIGLGTKIYTKMVYEFGSLYSWNATRSNKEHIGKIYKNLDGNPKIEVTTIPGKDGGVDYLAVLKGHNIFENAEKNKVLISEGWSKDKKRIIDRCVKIIKTSNKTITTAKAYKIEEKIANKYFHGEMAGSLKIRKFEPMITKILVQELGYPDCPTTTDEQNFLQSVVKYIWNYEVRQNKTPIAVGSFEGSGPDDYETLVSKYKPLIEQVRGSIENLNDKSSGNNDYEIIRIPDFEEAKKWGKYSWPQLPLCYTTHENQWDNFTNFGKNNCFLCLNKNTWHNWDVGETPEDNNQTPYDEYGLSMIWVFISPEGKIAYSNTRWNHNQENRIPDMPYGGIDVDESFSKEALEDLLGMSFENAFNVEHIYKKINDDVRQKIEKASIKGLDALLDLFARDNNWEVQVFNEKNEIIKIYSKKIDKFNLLKKTNGKWELAFPKLWFESITKEFDFNGIIGKVAVFDGDGVMIRNLIDTNCNTVLPNNLWCQRILEYESRVFGNFVHGFKLVKDNLINIFIPGKGLLFDDFICKLGCTNQCILFTANSDGSISVYPPDGKSPVSLNDILTNYFISRGQDGEIPPYIKEYLKIGKNDAFLDYFGGKYNIFDKESGRPVFNFWVNNIEYLDNDFKKVYFDADEELVNILNKDNELLVNKPPLEWPSDVLRHYERYFVIEGNEDIMKHNICGLDGNFMFDINDEDSWVTDINIFESKFNTVGKYLIFLGDYLTDGLNLADENLNLLWKGKWFTALKFREGYKTGIFPVRSEKGWNYFSLHKMNILYDVPEEKWFAYTFPFIEGASVSCVKIDDDNYNFIDANGKLLFEKSYIKGIDSSYAASGNFMVKNSNKKYNFLKLAKGVLASDKWFDEMDYISESLVRVYIKDEDFYYNLKECKFVENASKNSSHDFSDYNGNLLDYLKKLDFNEVRTYIEGKLYRVRDHFFDGEKYNLVGLVNGEAKYLLSAWCQRIGLLHGNGVLCKINYEKYNIFNVSTSQYVFEQPLKFVDWDEDCFVVYSTYQSQSVINIVNTKCEILLKTWVRSCCYEGNEDGNIIYRLTFEDRKQNLFCINKKAFLVKKNFYSVFMYSTNLVHVGMNTENGIVYNLVANGQDLVFDKWAPNLGIQRIEGHVITYFLDENDNEWINICSMETGELLSDEPISIACPEEGEFRYKLVKNGKINFLRDIHHVKYSLPTWADSVTDFLYGEYALAMIGGKEYTLFNNPDNGQYIVEGDVEDLKQKSNDIDSKTLVSYIRNSNTYTGRNDGYNKNGMANLKHEINIDGINAKQIRYIISPRIGLKFVINGIRNNDGSKIENQPISLDIKTIKDIIDVLD